MVYCAFEGQEGFKARVEVYRSEHGISDDEAAFFLITKRRQAGARSSDADRGYRRARSAAPVAVVLDTLNRSIDGSESRDQDMGAYLDAASAIQQAFECVVLIVHHCGIDGSRPRGHTSITGTCEAQIAVRKDGSDNVVAEVEYMKDGPSGARFTSKLKVVEIGFNELGEPESSCVIEEADESLIPSGRRRSTSPPPRPQRASVVRSHPQCRQGAAARITGAARHQGRRCQGMARASLPLSLNFGDGLAGQAAAVMG